MPIPDPEGRAINPDPFSVALGVAGIGGGLASAFSALAAYRTLLASHPVKIQERIGRLLHDAQELGRSLRADLDVLAQLLREADISSKRLFWFGSTALLGPEQFDRYAKTAEEMTGRLWRLLKITHQLERALARLAPLKAGPEDDYLVRTRARIGLLLRDPKVTVDDAYRELIRLVDELNALMGDIQASLGIVRSHP